MDRNNSEKVVPITSADVRPSVDEAMARDGLSQTAVARESGLSTSAVSQYLAGNYKGNLAAVERKLAKWLVSRDRRSTMTSAAIPEAAFFEGPAALKIMATLEYAQQAGDMASIIGAPGVGKTRAANEYAGRNPNCWIATITPSSSNVAMTLTEICDVIGVHPENFRGARSMAQIVRMRVRGTHGLLIVDEAQHLTLPAIEEIRSIHDATGVGIALLGSYAFQARVSHERLQARTAQIMSRLGMRVSIARPTDEDVEAMLDAWKISGAKERAFLKKLAAGAGALRNVAKTIRLAGLSAAAVKEPLQFKHLEDARAALDGE
ncbi:MAG: AAA family ATPase [Candidatus Binatus sp.]|jgi:DNA transposition AAA+ family ATPase|uniref:AAA family ATPase n=1 Tax=Candidatus Binatus sp. TaxID=2811406 RepID=UPI003CB30548